jgi:hypothetical protein
MVLLHPAYTSAEISRKGKSREGERDIVKRHVEFPRSTGGKLQFASLENIL